MTDTLPARRPGRLADIVSGAIAGIPAGLSFLLVEGIDNKLSRRRLFDLQLLGRPFVRSRRKANVLGVFIHLGNSMALGALYGLVTHRLPGTPAIRGTIFVSIENTILYPALALERFHPARKAGEMGSYWAFRSWLWTMPRHIAYGTILAVCFDRLRNE